MNTKYVLVILLPYDFQIWPSFQDLLDTQNQSEDLTWHNDLVQSRAPWNSISTFDSVVRCLSQSHNKLCEECLLRFVMESKHRHCLTWYLPLAVLFKERPTIYLKLTIWVGGTSFPVTFCVCWFHPVRSIAAQLLGIDGSVNLSLSGVQTEICILKYSKWK